MSQTEKLKAMQRLMVSFVAYMDSVKTMREATINSLKMVKRVHATGLHPKGIQENLKIVIQSLGQTPDMDDLRAMIVGLL